jgi:hypothetical protein
MKFQHRVATRAALAASIALPLYAASDCEGCDGIGGGSLLIQQGSCGMQAQLHIQPLNPGSCDPEGTSCQDGDPCKFLATYGWNFGTTSGFLGYGYRQYDSDNPNNPQNGSDQWQVPGSSGTPTGSGAGQVELFLMCGGLYEGILAVASSDPDCPNPAKATARIECTRCLVVISGPG